MFQTTVRRLSSRHHDRSQRAYSKFHSADGHVLRKISTKACSKRLGSAAHLVVELQNGQAGQQYEESF